MSNIAQHFTTTESGVFRFRRGAGFHEGPTPCQLKLCITATDEEYLVGLLYEVSQRPDCFYVKYSPSSSPKSRDGMMLGRIFMTDVDAVGALWASLYGDRKLMCNLRDDTAVEAFRSGSESTSKTTKPDPV